MEFESYRSYYVFADSVRKEWRYARSAAATRFLETMFVTSTSRQQVLPAGARLWRAQLGHVWRSTDIGDGVMEEVPEPFAPERMHPLSDRATEGRANPRGIPHLYVATREETAITEVRPWIGSHVSISQFVLRRDVTVVNCVADDRRVMAYGGEPDPAERERAVWQAIDRAFSEPVTRGDDIAEYAATQVIAEFFREKGLDGIAYGSSLGDGHNVALFAPSVARLKNCGLVIVDGIHLDVSRAGETYVVQDTPVEAGE